MLAASETKAPIKIEGGKDLFLFMCFLVTVGNDDNNSKDQVRMTQEHLTTFAGSNIKA